MDDLEDSGEPRIGRIAIVAEKLGMHQHHEQEIVESWAMPPAIIPMACACSNWPLSRFCSVMSRIRASAAFLGMSIRIGGLYRLAKPFKPQDLLDLVAAILTSPPHGTGIPAHTLAVTGH
jgi:hypothetical protein